MLMTLLVRLRVFLLMALRTLAVVCCGLLCAPCTQVLIMYPAAAVAFDRPGPWLTANASDRLELSMNNSPGGLLVACAGVQRSFMRRNMGSPRPD